MKLGQVITLYGKVLGATGIAVFAYLSAQPGATYGEIAEGLDMGESTVKKSVRQMEELGLVARTHEITPKGLHLPTRLHLQDPVIRERGTSDNPPINGNGVIRERVVNTGPGLSDPVIRERGLRGTEVAPSKAETISSNNPQPSVGAGADAPPAAAPSKASKVRSSKADPRTSHPAIVAVFEVMGRRPDKDIYNAIIRTLGDDPDGQRLVECFEAWRGMGYRANNYGWITDWYAKGIPEKARNGKRELTYEPEPNGIIRGNFSRPNVSARTQRQNDNAGALMRGAVQRVAAAQGGVRGGGEPVDS